MTEEPKSAHLVVELATDALGEERTSAENLGARATWLIGFAGVVLSLTAAFGRDVGSARLSHLERTASDWLFVIATILLAAAAALGVVVVSPKRRGRTPMKLLDDIGDGTLAATNVDGVRADLGKRLYRELADDNDMRGRRLSYAFWVLVLGLACVAAPAVIIGIARIEA